MSTYANPLAPAPSPSLANRRVLCGLACATWHHDGADVPLSPAAGRPGTRCGGSSWSGQRFEGESDVGLVRPKRRIASYRSFSAVAAEFVTVDLSPEAAHDGLTDREHVFLLHERHLEVELGELRLTICAEVLVTEASRRSGSNAPFRPP